MTEATFEPWPKIARLNREITVTEKIDGTNAAILIEPGDARDPQDGWCAGVYADDVFYKVGAQSRKRTITPGDDNFGFAQWVSGNSGALVNALGPGRHFGEWWGSGIQRGYDLPKGEKRFSLFNTARYASLDPGAVDWGLWVVPVLYQGPFSEDAIQHELKMLAQLGSVASLGFMRPEGVVVFHSAAQTMFKATIEGDEAPKSKGKS